MMDNSTKALNYWWNKYNVLKDLLLPLRKQMGKEEPEEILKELIRRLNETKQTSQG